MKTRAIQAAGMSDAMIAGGGSGSGEEAVGSVRAAVVYEARSRRVLHVHHMITFGKATPPSDKEIEDRALELARSNLQYLGLRTGTDLRALAVAPEALVPGTEYKVDRVGALVAGRSLSGPATQTASKARHGRGKKS